MDDSFIVNELRDIKEQLQEINNKLDDLSYLSQLEEIAAAISKLSPDPTKQFVKPKLKK